MEKFSIAWRRVDRPGHEAATLLAVDGAWRLEGAAAFLESGLPCHLRYEIEVDAHWHTRAALVQGWFGTSPVNLRVHADRDHRWRLNDNLVPAVAGALDIDLAFTPATNLLPIRRLALPVGGSAPVIAAWLRFPDLELRRLEQVYRRAADDAYDYSSAGGSFRATLSVTPQGFVTHYPGLWIEETG